MQENENTRSAEGGGLPQRELMDYFFLFLERSWIIFICVIGAAIYAQYELKSTPETYRATASVEVVRNLSAAGDISSSQMQWRLYTDLTAKVAEKMNMDSLFYLVTDRPEIQELLPDRASTSEEEYERARRSLAAWMNRITNVKFRPRSPLLEIELVHTDPEIATKIISGMLEEYEKLGTERREGETTANLEFLTRETERIRNNITSSEQSLVVYKEAFAIKEEIRSTESKIREMEKVYLDKWPALVQERAHLKSLRESFTEELERITETSATEYEFWLGQAEKMQNLSDSAKSSFQIQTAEARNNMLKRDFETESKLYESLLSQMKRGSVEGGIEQSEISVLQPPYASDQPIGPIPMKIYIRYGILGFGGGFLIAFFLGIMDSTIRRVEDLERVSGVSAFSAVPKTAKLKEVLSMASNTNSSEAFRTLHTNIILKHPKAKTILITSSIPGEGKSTVSSNLAATAASWGWGEKVLLIDLDLRRPRIAGYVGASAEHLGINDCLQGSCAVEEAIQIHPKIPELSIMTAGKARFQTGLPNDKLLIQLIEILKGKYDRIIIDTAPVLAVNDTMVIAKHVDVVCLAFRMWKTPRKALVRSLQQLEGNDTYPVGMIPNFMPQRKGLGQYGYYYSYSGAGYQSYS